MAMVVVMGVMEGWGKQGGGSGVYPSVIMVWHVSFIFGGDWVFVWAVRQGMTVWQWD